MSLHELFPEQLLDKEQVDAMIVWLRYYAAPAHFKKYMLIDWCHFCGVPLTREMVVEAGAEEL